MTRGRNNGHTGSVGRLSYAKSEAAVVAVVVRGRPENVSGVKKAVRRAYEPVTCAISPRQNDRREHNLTANKKNRPKCACTSLSLCMLYVCMCAGWK